MPHQPGGYAKQTHINKLQTFQNNITISNSNFYLNPK
jgi:hypothetical protein